MGWSAAHLRYAFKPANGAPYWPHRRRHLQQVLLFLYKSFEPPEEFFFCLLILLARARNTNKFFLKKRCHVGPFLLLRPARQEALGGHFGWKSRKFSTLLFPIIVIFFSLFYFYCTIWRNLLYSFIVIFLKIWIFRFWKMIIKNN